MDLAAMIAGFTPPPPTGTCACGAELYRNDSLCGACKRARDEMRDLVKGWRRVCPPRYADATFDGPHLAQRVRDRRALDVASALDDNSLPLVLMGPAGAGKTTLAAAVAARWITRQRKAAEFATAFDLATARVDHGKYGETPEIIDAARRVPLLLLDDVGNEPIRADSELVPIIFRRHERELPTIITLSIGRLGVGQRYGDGFGRRVFEGAKVIEMSLPAKGHAATLQPWPSAASSSRESSPA